MGILNITPDSFADAGKHLDPADAIASARQMAADGVDIIDVGGESTRPGAEPLPPGDEMRRVLPVVEALASTVTVPISIDTYKADVASEALRLGASIVNDVSGLQYDPALGCVVADAGAAIVLMHTRGRSREMYDLAVYGDAPLDVARELTDAIGRAARAGIRRDSIVVDPGLGFAKRAEHTYEVLAHLDAIASLDRPILAGPSRKSFLKAAIGDRAAADRDWGTAAAITASVLFGAHIVRVHDVSHMVDVVRVADRIRAAAFDGAE
jgi:dihydropteroate synthase